MSLKPSEAIMTLDKLCRDRGITIDSDVATNTFVFTKESYVARRSWNYCWDVLAANSPKAIVTFLNELTMELGPKVEPAFGKVVYAFLLEQSGWLASCAECIRFMASHKVAKESASGSEGQRRRYLLIAGTIEGIRNAAELMAQVERMPNVRVVRVKIKHEQGNGWNTLEPEQWPKPQGETFIGIRKEAWQEPRGFEFTFGTEGKPMGKIKL